MTTSRTQLLAPLVGTGVLMAAYLLTRPYGDMPDAASQAAAAAFASPWWVVAHLCGALALASVGRLALRLDDQLHTAGSRVARWSGLAGVVLVLPYYGAETFGLHAIGRAAQAGDASTLALVDTIRNHPAALASFGVGLLLLAISAMAMAVTWSRAHRSSAAWPLASLIALVLPQFFLPPAGRMAFGVLYLAAAAWWLLDVSRSSRRAPARPATVTGVRAARPSTSTS